MLAKCANPACSNHFLYLHQGKLFRLDRESGEMAVDSDFHEHSPHVEFFWLCDHCAADMTIVVERGKGITVQRLRFTQRAAS